MAAQQRTSAKDAPTPAARQDIALDDVDWRILDLLARQARIANSALAEQVGVAPSTCLQRVRRLRHSGVIRAFRADLSPGAVGRPLQALVSVRLQAQARAEIGTFAARFARLPGVMSVFFLGGSNDFLIHVAVPSSEHLRDFVVRHLSALREVASTETTLVFEHVVAEAPLTARP